MKTVFSRGFLVGILVSLVWGAGLSQLELPRKSPKASVSYTVGLTGITIEYSSPAVNDREIWGSLVPYNEVWRAGANEATTITFSTDVVIEGKELPKGRYAFFIIPRRGEDAQWTAIFNREADQWGAFQYDEKKDALRIDVRPQFKQVNQERLEYSIHDQGMDRGYIKMAWEQVRVYLRFKVDVLEKALDNIYDALDKADADEKWVIYAQGADFLLENDIETRQAMEWADKSTSMHDHSWNWYIKAQLQAKVGDYSGAVTSAEKSAEIGMTNEKDNFYQNAQKEIEEKVTLWKKKSGL